jgi:hypothetical protein
MDQTGPWKSSSANCAFYWRAFGDKNIVYRHLCKSLIFLPSSFSLLCHLEKTWFLVRLHRSGPWAKVEKKLSIIPQSAACMFLKFQRLSLSSPSPEYLQITYPRSTLALLRVHNFNVPSGIGILQEILLKVCLVSYRRWINLSRLFHRCRFWARRHDGTCYSWIPSRLLYKVQFINWCNTHISAGWCCFILSI